MEQLNEKLLAAWLDMTSVVNNERIVARIPFNEAHVCNLLYRQRMKSPDTYLTATELCARTKMLKSQMNKVLTSLENRRMIERFPAPTDRRKAYIRLVEENLPEFEAVHAHSLALVDHAMERLGPELSLQTLEILTRLARCMDEPLDGGKK